jgi:hypothetical protein
LSILGNSGSPRRPSEIDRFDRPVAEANLLDVGTLSAI